MFVMALRRLLSGIVSIMGPNVTQKPAPLETVHVGGFNTVRADRTELAKWMTAYCLAARGGEIPPAILFSSNGQGLALQGKNADYDAAMAAADVIHADGMPVVFASRVLTKKGIRGRSATTDLFHDVAREAVANGLKFYVLGAKEDQNQRATEAMQRLYPGLQVVGRRNGYFGPDNDAEVCADIVASGADVLWVALGKPKQEIWCHRNRDRLTGIGCIKTCGGLYAFLAGDVARAPDWMQSLGLEWLFRLLGDPKRLFKRYLVTNMQALVCLVGRTRH